MALRASYQVLLWCVAICTFSPPALAIVLLNEQFLTSGTLEGTTPMPGPPSPTLKVWNAGAGGGVSPVQVVDGAAVIVQQDGTGGGGEDQANDFGERGANATTFARFDFRLPAADNSSLATDTEVAASGSFFIALRAQTPAASLRARMGVLPPTSGGSFRLAINADNGTLTNGEIWASDLSFDTTYRTVISFDAVSATSKLWLNPTDINSTSISHTGAGASIGTDIDRIVLRQSTDYTGKQLIDNLVVATTFAEALNPITITGDFNGNGVVDAADYVLWRKSSGTLSGATVSQGDSDGDGDVDGADYNNWRGLFNNAPGLGSGFAAVPEPATAVLIACVIAFCAFQRKHM